MPGAAGEFAFGEHKTIDGLCGVFWQLIDRKQNAQIVRNAVESAAVNNPDSSGLGRLVVAVADFVYEFWFTGNVHVISTVFDAGLDHAPSVFTVRANRRHEYPRFTGQSIEALLVAAVCLYDIDMDFEFLFELGFDRR